MLKYTVMGKSDDFLALLCTVRYEKSYWVHYFHHIFSHCVSWPLRRQWFRDIIVLILTFTAASGQLHTRVQNRPAKNLRATGPVLCPISGALCTFFLCPNCSFSYSKALAQIFLPEKQALSNLPGSPCF